MVGGIGGSSFPEKIGDTQALWIPVVSRLESILSEDVSR